MNVGIIGGGVGGMMTALLLARQGKQAVLYERQAALGGRLAYETNGEHYRIDRGPTIVLLPQMLQSLMAEAGIAESEVELMLCDPLYHIHYGDGTRLTKYRDSERMAEEMERLYPGEGAGVRRYLSDMKALFSAAQSQFLERSFVRRREFFTPRNLGLLSKLQVHLSARQLAGRYFNREQAIDAFSLQTLYVGGMPSGSPSLYTFIPYAEHAFGIWYVRGGYAGLSEVLARRLQDAGVEVRLGEEGEIGEIIARHGKVHGLRTKTGTEHRHDTVVFNGDYPHLAHLLPGVKLPARREYVPSSGTIMIYVGTDRRWGEKDKAVHTNSTDQSVIMHQFFLPSSLTASLKRLERGEMPASSDEAPAYYVFNPCALDGQAAPPSHSVLYFLIPIPLTSKWRLSAEQWRERGAQMAEKVLADAESRAFPGLRASIRWQSVRTPADGEAEGWYRGGSFGIAPTLLQSGVFRPQMIPYKINGLYSVGASIHPGGGIPIVMQGAKLVADHIVKESSPWTESS